MSNLRACPFCGQTKLRVLKSRLDDVGFCGSAKVSYVYCVPCSIRGPIHEAEDCAIKLWNTRATEDRMAKDLAEAKAKLRHVCEIMSTLDLNDALNEVLLDMHAYLFPEATAVRLAAQEKKP